MRKLVLLVFFISTASLAGGTYVRIPAGEFTSVLKYSPFAYTVGVPEITKQAMTLTAITL